METTNQDKETAQFITTLTEHMRNVELMMRNYTNVMAMIKELS